jgi:hypothetical protein
MAPSPRQPDQDPPATTTHEIKSCPSAPCIEGALLLGVRTGAGRLAYVQPPTRVDSAFVATAHERGRPESRLRFSLPCIEAGCSQWNGNGCGLIDLVMDDERPAPAPTPVGELAAESTVPTDPPAPSRGLPACAIRRTCRWYHQRGAEACAVCPLVVADCGGTATYRSRAADRADPLRPTARTPLSP